MNDRGTLARCNEAFAYIEGIKNPVTQNLVKMAFMQFVFKAHTGEREAPQGDLDMVYVVKVMEKFLGEHEVIARTLQGERVGAFWEDTESPAEIATD